MRQSVWKRAGSRVSTFGKLVSSKLLIILLRGCRYKSMSSASSTAIIITCRKSFLRYICYINHIKYIVMKHDVWIYILGSRGQPQKVTEHDPKSGGHCYTVHYLFFFFSKTKLEVRMRNYTAIWGNWLISSDKWWVMEFYHLWLWGRHLQRKSSNCSWLVSRSPWCAPLWDSGARLKEHHITGCPLQ